MILLVLGFLSGWNRVAGETVGIPWTGQTGMTETVEGIMNRSKQALPGVGAPGELKKRALRNFSARSRSPYFIGVDNITHGLLVLRRVTNPGGIPSMGAGCRCRPGTRHSCQQRRNRRGHTQCVQTAGRDKVFRADDA